MPDIKIKSCVVSSGKSVICIKGLKSPGEDIKPEDLKTPENFKKLLEKGTICYKKDYQDNKDSQFRASDVKKNEEKEVDKKNNIGAKK